MEKLILRIFFKAICIAIVLWAYHAIKDVFKEDVHFRMESSVCSDVVWIGTDKGLYIQYESADNVAPKKVKTKLHNIVDLVELADSTNTVAVTVWDGHKIQTVLVDEDGVFGATPIEQVNPAQWEKFKETTVQKTVVISKN